jgi:hypothetical protein
MTTKGSSNFLFVSAHNPVDLQHSITPSPFQTKSKQAIPSNMKFTTAFAFAAFAGVASAKFSIRAASSKLHSGTKASTDPTDARIAVHGMKHEASPEDLDVIAQTIVTAYNHAYEGAGYTIESFKAQSTASLPETTSWMPDCRFCPPDDDAVTLKESESQGQLVLARLTVGWTPDCRFCPPDDDAHALLDLGDLHRKFEKKFCSDLRNSGSVNLANARDCSFSFLDMPGQPDQNMPIQASESFRSGEKAEAQVMLHGTVQEFSEKDYELIDQSVVEAYEEAFFTSAGFSLNSVEIVADLDITVGWMPDCRFCPPDDDATMASAAKLVVAHVTPVGWTPDCRFCPPDDDAAVVKGSLSDAQLGYLHEAFEKAFCHKLQNSGAVNFANVHDCSFRFVYSSTVSEEIASAEIAQK